jgi:hypothetical protein
MSSVNFQVPLEETKLAVFIESSNFRQQTTGLSPDSLWPPPLNATFLVLFVLFLRAQENISSG